MRPWISLAFLLSVCGALSVQLGCTKEMDAYPSNYAGIGVELEMEASGARVTNVLGGGSASAGGLRPDDLILKIDGDLSRGKSLADIVDQLRGPEGTPVAVTLRARQGERTVTLTRRSVSLANVKSAGH